MTKIEKDDDFGRLIYTDKAISKMDQYGLYNHHIVDALKRGFEVKSIVDGLRQFSYRHAGEKEIGLLVKTHESNGEPIGGVLIISCLAKNVK